MHIWNLSATFLQMRLVYTLYLVYLLSTRFRQVSCCKAMKGLKWTTYILACIIQSEGVKVKNTFTYLIIEDYLRYTVAKQHSKFTLQYRLLLKYQTSELWRIITHNLPGESSSLNAKPSAEKACPILWYSLLYGPWCFFVWSMAVAIKILIAPSISWMNLEHFSVSCSLRDIKVISQSFNKKYHMVLATIKFQKYEAFCFMCYTYRSVIFCGRSGACSVMKKFAPTSSSFSAFLLPAFHRFSSVQVKKCCQTSLRESTGCRQTELTKACSWALRCSMNCSSYLPERSGDQLNT